MKIFSNFYLAALVMLLLFLCIPSLTQAQDLYSLIENCHECCEKIKSIKTKHKIDYRDYDSPTLQRTDEYDTSNKLIKTEIRINRALSRTIYYKYKDSLLVYEKHVVPHEENFYLFYQYFKKGLPTKIIKANNKNQIINISQLEYTEDYIPVFIKSYNLLGELLHKTSVEYMGKNQIIIRSFNPKNNLDFLEKHQMLCKFNKPKKLRKKDFKDVITKPINIEHEDNLVRIVKAVKTENERERVHIEEVNYDQYGNWIKKRIYELKNNKNKRRLIDEIKREIEYY